MFSSSVGARGHPRWSTDSLAFSVIDMTGASLDRAIADLPPAVVRRLLLALMARLFRAAFDFRVGEVGCEI